MKRPGGIGRKLGRFAIVGVANTAIDLAVFAICLDFALRPLASNFAGWSAAVLFSFVANSFWSFERDRSKRLHHSLLQFVSLGALISLGVSNLALVLLPAFIGVWASKIAGIVLAAALNFLAAKWSIEGRLV